MNTTDHSTDIVRQFFLEENPNPERVGCPPEGTLQAAAENRLPVNDPARLHMADCSECFAEYRGYRLDWERKQAAKRRFIGWAVAASLLFGIVGGAFAFRHHFSHSDAPQQIAINTTPRGGLTPPLETTPVTPAPKQEDPHRPIPPEPRPPRRPPNETRPTGGPPTETPPRVPSPPAPVTPDNRLVPAILDLSNHSLPGDPDRARKEAFILPASNLKLRVILPTTTQEGTYTLRLTKDIEGQDVLASATGEATTQEGIVSLDLKMLLRGQAAGSYYLFINLKSGGKPKIYDLRIVPDQASSSIK